MPNNFHCLAPRKRGKMEARSTPHVKSLEAYFCQSFSLRIFGRAGWRGPWQELQIQFPQDGQQVRGEITVRFTGVPDGGNVNVTLDGNWIMSSSQGSFPLNTFDLKSLSPNLPNEGTHKPSLRAIDAGGKRVDEKTVWFEVANTRVDTSGEGVLLTHYEDWMRSGSQRAAISRVRRKQRLGR